MDETGRKEWLAWLLLCDVLQTRNIDINTDSLLARAIEHWGERLAALRSSQGRSLSALSNAAQECALRLQSEAEGEQFLSRRLAEHAGVSSIAELFRR